MKTTSAHIASAGAPLSRAKAAMILLHGRGASTPRHFNGLAFSRTSTIPIYDFLFP